MALFDYVLRGESRSRRDILEGALRPIIVLGALIAFGITLSLQSSKPAPKTPTEVMFFSPSATPLALPTAPSADPKLAEPPAAEKAGDSPAAPLKKSPPH